jgi:hypothetical protein
MGKGKNKKKKGGDGLHSKVFETEFHSNKRGRFFYFCNALGNLSMNGEGRKRSYVNYCEYKQHPGLIEDVNVCNKRACGMMRKISLVEGHKDSRCNNLYKVYVARSKEKYVNRR